MVKRENKPKTNPIQSQTNPKQIQFKARELSEHIRDKMGDTADIYHEVPKQMTAERSANLLKGLEYYLRQEKDSV